MGAQRRWREVATRRTEFVWDHGIPYLGRFDVLCIFVAKTDKTRITNNNHRILNVKQQHSISSNLIVFPLLEVTSQLQQLYEASRSDMFLT
jgi:hypothetical protein